jgi:hypothetical protein
LENIANATYVAGCIDTFYLFDRTEEGSTVGGFLQQPTPEYMTSTSSYVEYEECFRALKNLIPEDLHKGPLEGSPTDARPATTGTQKYISDTIAKCALKKREAMFASRPMDDQEASAFFGRYNSKSASYIFTVFPGLIRGITITMDEFTVIFEALFGQPHLSAPDPTNDPYCMALNGKIMTAGSNKKRHTDVLVEVHRILKDLHIPSIMEPKVLASAIPQVNEVGRPKSVTPDILVDLGTNKGVLGELKTRGHVRSYGDRKPTDPTAPQVHLNSKDKEVYNSYIKRIRTHDGTLDYPTHQGPLEKRFNEYEFVAFSTSYLGAMSKNFVDLINRCVATGRERVEQNLGIPSDRRTSAEEVLKSRIFGRIGLASQLAAARHTIGRIRTVVSSGSPQPEEEEIISAHDEYMESRRSYAI